MKGRGKEHKVPMDLNLPVMHVLLSVAQNEVTLKTWEWGQVNEERNGETFCLEILVERGNNDFTCMSLTHNTSFWMLNFTVSLGSLVPRPSGHIL